MKEKEEKVQHKHWLGLSWDKVTKQKLCFGKILVYFYRIWERLCCGKQGWFDQPKQ